jgi:hypothetical protein
MGRQGISTGRSDQVNLKSVDQHKPDREFPIRDLQKGVVAATAHTVNRARGEPSESVYLQPLSI